MVSTSVSLAAIRGAVLPTTSRSRPFLVALPPLPAPVSVVRRRVGGDPATVLRVVEDIEFPAALPVGSIDMIAMQTHFNAACSWGK